MATPTPEDHIPGGGPPAPRIDLEAVYRKLLQIAAELRAANPDITHAPSARPQEGEDGPD
jgi:hypothetical protein